MEPTSDTTPKKPSTSAEQVRIDKALLGAYDAILAKNIGAGLLVNESHQIVHYFGDVRAYLKVETGRVQRDVLECVSGALRLAVTRSLMRAGKELKQVVSKQVRLEGGVRQGCIDLVVDPIKLAAGEGYYFHLQFKPAKGEETVFSETMALEKVEETSTPSQAMRERIVCLEKEVLDLEQGYENLLKGLDSGIVFVDRDLRIRKFNQAMAEAFNILTQDVGRPIDYIAYHLENQDEFLAEVRQVIESGNALEREVRTREGNWLLRRIRPYYGKAGEADGAVICFTDITGFKKTQEKIELAIQVVRMVWWEWDIASQRIYSHAQDWCLLGYDLRAMDTRYDAWMALVHPDDQKRVEASLKAMLEGRVNDWRCQHRFRNVNGSWIWVMNIGRASAHSSDGKAKTVIGTVLDLNQFRDGDPLDAT